MRLSLKRTEAGSRFSQSTAVDRDTPWREAQWCAIDLELTGLHRSDEIIAIGAVPIRDGALILGEAMYSLARPEHPPKHASVLVHKLRSADLREAPPLDEAIDELLQIVDRSHPRVPHRDGRAGVPGQGVAPAPAAPPRRRGHRGAGPRVAAPPRRRHSGGPPAVAPGGGARPGRGGPPSRAGRRADDGARRSSRWPRTSTRSRRRRSVRCRPPSGSWAPAARAGSGPVSGRARRGRASRPR